MRIIGAADGNIIAVIIADQARRKAIAPTIDQPASDPAGVAAPAGQCSACAPAEWCPARAPLATAGAGSTAGNIVRAWSIVTPQAPAVTTTSSAITAKRPAASGDNARSKERRAKMAEVAEVAEVAKDIMFRPFRRA